MKFHSDFDHPWCQALLASNIDAVEVPWRLDTADGASDTAAKILKSGVSNSMFAETLSTGNGIRAQITFERQTNESDAVTAKEYCFLLSLGSGLDGKTGRAHGGLSALLLDQATGMVAAKSSVTFAPATATMTVDYKAPIDTPCVVLCRAWATEMVGRKTWSRGVIQDGTGRVLAVGKALFIHPRPEKI